MHKLFGLLDHFLFHNSCLRLKSCIISGVASLTDSCMATQAAVGCHWMLVGLLFYATLLFTYS